MIASIESELIKLRRPAVLYGTLGAMTAIAVLSTALVFAFAGDESTFNSGRPGAVDVSTAALASSSGWVRGFTVGAGFGGVVLLIAFAASVASEFAGGTIRMLLVAEPRRLRLLFGKLVALAALVSAGFAVALAASVVTALVGASLRGISVDSWFTGDGLRELALAYGEAAIAGAGWGLFGAAVAIVVRGMLPTLGILLVWFFPFENILHNRWTSADSWFPGLLLQGIRPESAADLSRTFLVLGLYLFAALAVASLSFARRDVTT